MGWVWRRWKHALLPLVLVTTLAAAVVAMGPSAVSRPKKHHHPKHGKHLAKGHHKNGTHEEAHAASNRVAGIDVSTYQGRIDWTSVASTRVRFAIMRSSLGNDYVDDRYRPNLSGANRNGIVVGAYHFAKPGRGRWDAVREADHFLTVARNAPGDLLPVLDIESSGGLPRGELRHWALTWLRRVYARTGVKAMIYSGNFFWRTHMGNTSFFARRGHPLWLAHWYVNTPEVPGAHWASRGWTVWQRSATGRVSGIRGDVDRNTFKGRTLAGGTIAQVRVLPAEGGMIRGELIACGASRTRCSRLANPDATVRLEAAPLPGSRFVHWTGACAPAGEDAVCRMTATGELAASAVFEPVEALPDWAAEASGAGDLPAWAADDDEPAAPLPPPSPAPMPSVVPAPEEAPAADPAPIEASPAPAPSPQARPAPAPSPGVRPAGCDESCPTTPTGPSEAGARLVATMPLQFDDHETAYRWSRREDARAIGGSYRWEHRAGGSAAFVFQGSAVTVYTIDGQAMGRARLRIDGRVVATVDGFSRSLRRREHRFAGLGAGEHRLTVTVLGTRRPSSKGTRVAVDALRTRAGFEADPVPVSATWARDRDPAASGGSYAIADAPGAEGRLLFAGTGVELRARRGPDAGKLQIHVDGRYIRTVDLYAERGAFASIAIARGLDDSPHVVRLVVLGTHRRVSGGSEVAIDRWTVDRAIPA